MTLHRIKRNIALKLRLSAALLVAGAFSITRPKDSWPRIIGALRTWLRWRRDPRPTPRLIYFGRVRQCFRCPFLHPGMKTCGSPLSKALKDVGCHCSVIHMAAVLEKDCWAREQGVDESLGWPDSLRRLSVPLHSPPESGMVVSNDGRIHSGSATNRSNPAPCRPCGTDAL